MLIGHRDANKQVVSPAKTTALSIKVTSENIPVPPPKPTTDTIEKEKQRNDIQAKISFLLNNLVTSVYNTLKGEQSLLTPVSSWSAGNSVLVMQGKAEIAERDLQIEVLKGHLARRNKLLAEQRTSYLKELAILREQIYQKQNPSSVPSNLDEPPTNVDAEVLQLELCTHYIRWKIGVNCLITLPVK